MMLLLGLALSLIYACADNVRKPYTPEILASSPTVAPSAAPTRLPASGTGFLSASPSVQPLYDGETFSSSDIRYAASVAGTGLSDTYGLQLQPDPYHAPAFLLKAPVYRSKLGSLYSHLNMHVRCSSANVPLTIKFGRWTATGTGGSSNVLSLGLYAEPLDSPAQTSIGTSWTKIRIPITAFANTAWDMSGPEWIYFNSDSRSRKCWVDNIYLDSIAPATPTAAPSSLRPTAAPSSAAPTRAAIGAVDTILASVPGVQPVYDGEAGGSSSSDIRFAQSAAGTGLQGSTGLQLQPDPWHAPGFLLGSPVYRNSRAGSLYTYLNMYVRCSASEVPLSVHFTRWVPSADVVGSSATLFLGAYADPLDTPAKTTIGTAWTKVRIPIADFLVSGWDLSGPEMIYFNSDSSSRMCWVDNIYLEFIPTAVPTTVPSAAPSTATPTTASPTRGSVAVDSVDLVRVLGVEPMYDGESFSSTDIRYAQSVSGTGLLGSAGLQLQPDQWHSPAVLLQDPLYRSDIALYNEILLFARCEYPETPLSMHFGRWVSPISGNVGSSPSVFLGSYAEPLDSPAKTTIGTAWTKVRIPITAFVTPEWGLAGSEWVYFNSDKSNRKCWIDNMLLRENVGPYVVGAEKVTDNILRVQTNKYFELNSARVLSNYELHSSDGVSTTVVSPVSAGLQYRFENFKDNSWVPKSNYHINILFADKIDCSKSHVLRMANITDPATNPMLPTSWPLECPQVVLSKSIKVNQEGYLPGRPKIAYVGDYFGDLQGAVWAVGASGSIWFGTRVSGQFTKVTALPAVVFTRHLRAVKAVSPTDVWVVGDGGMIVHYDGIQWTVLDSPTTNDLLDIDFIPDRSTAYAVGKNGVILKFTPNTADSSGVWTLDSSPTTADLFTVWTGASDMWCGGSAGTVLRRSSPALPANVWKLQTAVTTETILSIEGVRVDYAVSMIATGGVKLWNRYGAWLVDTNIGFEIRAMALNPGFLKSGRGVGVGGQGTTMAMDTTPLQPFQTGTTANLNAVVLLEESVLFAFGEDGACVTGSSINFAAWKTCVLPEGATVYGADALVEGPLRLPFPRPDVLVQQQSTTDPAVWTTVGQFPLQLRAMNYHLSGEDVFFVDFSAMTTTGVHRLFVDGVGASYSFQVSTTALQDAAFHTCRTLYYQRSGMPNGLEVPYAEPRFTRPTDHEFVLGGRKIDGAFHWSVANSSLFLGEATCPLKTADCPPESLRDGAGGWFDAGDYSKYMATGAPAVWRLMTVVEILKARNLAVTDSLNIPESGDSVPDLLNEATWELLWMLKMQREDGGAYNKLASEIWEFGSPGGSELGGQFYRFFMARTTHDSATAGASFAMAARLWAPYDSALSSLFLSRATLAWTFLQQHSTASPEAGFVNPAGHISGPYYDVDDTDNRAWLAAELYRSTCNVEYGLKYVQFIVDAGNVVGMGGNDFVDYRLEAAWAFYYAACSNEPASFASTRKLIVTAMKSSANGSKSRVAQNPYKNVGRLDVPEWIGWGSSGAVNAAHFMGVLGWHMFNDESHLDWMSTSLDVVLGANPLAMSFVTGLGYKYPMDPTQGQSRTDDVVEPIPGYGVMGPFAHVSFQSPYFAVAQGDRANYPKLTQPTSPFPILRRWSDSNELPQYNEGCLTAMTYLCGVYQVLSATAARSSQ